MTPSKLTRLLDKEVDQLAMRVAAKHGLRGDAVWSFLHHAKDLKRGDAPLHLPELSRQAFPYPKTAQDYDTQLHEAKGRCQKIAARRAADATPPG